ncbi:MAG TPA: hypothetical protein VHA12_04460 [Candidatus Nanoarchaeia archaeon]|nr:hypothetical protein [Candidatus Nanoarchaeia archaeon]
MTLIDRIMFGGEKICLQKEHRPIAGYIEINRETREIVVGRYCDSRGESSKIKSGGKFTREEIEFTTISESGYTVDFKAIRNSRGWYSGTFEGQRQKGKIKVKIESCGRDVYKKMDAN